MDTFIYAFIYFTATIVFIRIFLNPLKRFLATIGEPSISYTIDGIGYRIIGKHELEIVPIKILKVENSESLIEANKYEMKTIHNCEKAYLEIPENIENKKVVSIGKRGMQGCCTVCYIKLPSSIRLIKDEAFAECHELIELSLPDSVKSIGNSTFRGCFSLEKITLGSGLKKIGSCTFTHCDNLNEIHCMGLPPTVGAYTFNKQLLSHCTLFVKAEYLAHYQQAADWKAFTHIRTE